MKILIATAKYTAPYCGAFRYTTNLLWAANQIDGVVMKAVPSSRAKAVIENWKPDIILLEFWTNYPTLIKNGSINPTGPRPPIGLIIHGITTNREVLKQVDFTISTPLLYKHYNRDKKNSYIMLPPYKPISVPPGKRRFITLPNGDTRKGVHLFEHLARKIYPRINRYGLKFLIVRGVQKYSGLPPRIGEIWPRQNDYGKVLANTKIMVHMSKYESYGYAWLEAAGAGIPVIGILTDGMRELRLKEWGMLIEHKDRLQEWDRAFQKILSDYDLWSEKAKQWVKKNIHTHEDVRGLIKWLERFV